MQKAARLFTQIAIFLLPLFFLPVTRDFFGFNKNYLLYGYTLVILFLFAIKLIKQKKLEFKTSHFDKYVLLLAGAYIVSLFISGTNKVEALLQPAGVGTIVSLTILYLLVRQFVQFKDLGTFFRPLLLSATVLSVWLILSATGVFSRIPFFPAVFKAQFITPLGSPFELMTFLGVLFVCALLWIGTNLKSTKKTTIVMTLFVFAGFAASIYALTRPGYKPLILPFSAGWSIAVDMLKTFKSALFGSGPNRFVNAFTLFKPRWLNQTDLWNVRFAISSNYYLSTLTETGILGFVSLLLLVFAYIKSKKKIIPVLVVLLTLLFLPQNLMLLVLLYVFFAVYAASESTTRVFLSGTTDHKNALERAMGESYNSRTMGFISAILGIVLLVGTAGLFYVLLRGYYGEMLITKGLRSAATTNNQETYNIQLKAIQINPLHSQYRIIFAQTNLALANVIAAVAQQNQATLTDAERQTIQQLILQAVNNGKVAIQLNPSAASWENLASIYRSLINIVQGADQWTVASYNQAIALDPTNPAIRLALGQVLYSLGAYDAATRQFELAVTLKPDYANAWYNLANAQRQLNQTELSRNSYNQALTFLKPDSNDYTQVKKELDALPKPPSTPASGILNQISSPEGTPSAQVNPPLEIGEQSAPELTVPEKEAAEATQPSKILKPAE